MWLESRFPFQFKIQHVTICKFINKTSQKPQNQVKLGEVAISDQMLNAYKKANNNNQPADCLVEVERLTDTRLRKAKKVYVSFLRTGETPAIDQVIYFQDASGNASDYYLEDYRVND